MNQLVVQDTENSAAQLRPMNMSDLPRVLKIIEQHDEDDAEAAEKDYHETGLEGQFVLDLNDQVLGVTGYRDIAGSDQSYWLSWTYLDPGSQGKGLGKAMLTQLVDRLRSEGARKIFTKVSDYIDPEHGNIYEKALKLYQTLGFAEELINQDFYDEDENQIILGLTLHGGDSDFGEALPIEDEKPIMRFDTLFEIAETEGAYTFGWMVKEKKKLFEKTGFTTHDLQLGLASVKDAGGRKVFLTFPSNLPLIHPPLQAAGFKYVGRLEDYYERGVHEYHFEHDLETI